MLTIDALKAALRRFTYKPGWRFILYQHPHEGIWLSIKAELPDADTPGQTTVVNVRTAVPPIPHETYLWQWMLWRIGRLESHEVREFARVDGRCLDDPHAPDAND